MTFATVAPTTSRTVPPKNSRQLAKQLVQDLQDQICQGLEEIDGVAQFQKDNWQRPGGGGGANPV
jgi:coproporphyrinogen III oxidase